MGITITRLDANVHAMKEFYPGLPVSGSPIGTGPVAVWRGKIQPIQSLDCLEELLDDIYNDRPVYVRRGGEVIHHPDCTATHEHHEWVKQVSNPFLTYKFEVKYAGGKAHPRGYVLDPILPRNKWKHIFVGDGAICPYPPWQGVWRWEEDTVVDYMDHAMLWLIRWTVWSQANIWIGAEMDHDPRFLRRIIGRNQECWCGAGEKYKKCHMSKDETTSSPELQLLGRLPRFRF